MAVVDWSERVPLNLDGVRLLGASLYLREVWLEKCAKKMNDIPVSLRPLIDFAETSKAIPESLQLLMKLEELETPKQVYTSAKNATISSFRFEWHHLFNNQWLVPYLKPRLPSLSRYVTQDEPIAILGNDNAVKSLKGIFREECWRQYRSKRDIPINTEPHPSSEAEINFYLCNADVIEAPAGNGAPKGRRTEDYRSHAVDYAWSIRRERQCSALEAVELALKKFTVVSTDKDVNGDRITGDSFIVAASENAALRRVYEDLKVIEKDEPAIKQTAI